MSGRDWAVCSAHGPFEAVKVLLSALEASSEGEEVLVSTLESSSHSGGVRRAPPSQHGLQLVVCFGCPRLHLVAVLTSSCWSRKSFSLDDVNVQKGGA